jgi:hypothetical protein
MLSKLQNTLRIAGQQLHMRAISRLPIINATELTKSTWARPVKSGDPIPGMYQDFFETLLSNGRDFPYTIFVPSPERFIHKTTEKLICDTGSEICVLERTGNTYQVMRYPLDSIRYIEHRTMLLDSSIKISGLTQQGIPASSIIKFNTITDYLFLPVLARIRLARFNGRSAVQGSELEKFDYLIRLNFKFMNFAKHSLIGGEKVIHAIYQPEIRESLWTILGRTYYRTIFPTHMMILTDQELILIRENESRGGEDKYGGTWDYIPLSQIESLFVEAKDEHLLALTIQVSGGERFNCLFQDSLKQEADQLLVCFRELTTTMQRGSSSRLPRVETQA